MQDSSLEKQMQQLMSGLEYEPDAAVWEHIRKEIAPKKKRRIAAWWWVSAIGLLLAGGGLVWYNTTQQPSGAIADHTMPYKPASGKADILIPSDNGNTAAVTTDKTQTAITADTSGNTSVTSSRILVTRDRTKPTATNHPGNESAMAAAITASGAVALQQAKQSRALQPGGKAIVSDNNSDQVGAPVTTDRLAVTAGLVNGNIVLASGIINNAPMAADIVPTSDHLATDSSLLKSPATRQYASFIPVIDIVPPSLATIKQGWVWEPFVGIGASSIGKGFGFSPHEPDAAAPNMDKYLFVQSGNGGASSAPTGGGYQNGYNVNNSYATSTRPYWAFRLGVRAHKAIARKWSIGLGLQYEYLSYNTILTTNSVSTFNSAVYSVSSSKENIPYRLHYIGLPVTMRYQLLRPLGVSAGIVNNIALAGRQRELNIWKDMRKYVPSAYLSFDITLPVKARDWYISPYLQYGLLSPYPSILQDKRMMQGGIQFSTRF